MKVYDAASIRNVAIVGHGGCGKTQLVSAMLFAAGAVNRLGRVDDGTTVTDFDEEEIARKHTLSSSLAHAEWQKTKINIIDTPGFANFLTDARAALRVVEAALVVVDAVAGVEVQTEKLWAEAAALEPAAHRRRQPPRSRARQPRPHARVAAPRLRPRDRPDPAADRRGEELHRRRRPGPHEGADVRRRRQRQDDRRRDSRGAGRRAHSSAREQLIEMVAEADEQLMETFFAEGTLTQEQLVAGLRAATMAGKLFPLVCTSGLHAIGIQPLLDAIVDYVAVAGRARLRRRSTPTAPRRRCKAADAAPYAAFVWKTIADPFAGRITMLRVVIGHAEVGHDRAQRHARRAGAARPPARAAGQDADARAGAEGRRPRRRRQAEGHAHQRRARRQGDQGHGSRAIKFPEPVLSYAIEPKSRGDEDKISTAMQRLRGGRPDRSATRAIRRRTSCCWPARASCTSRSPSPS